MLLLLLLLLMLLLYVVVVVIVIVVVVVVVVVVVIDLLLFLLLLLLLVVVAVNSFWSPFDVFYCVFVLLERRCRHAAGDRHSSTEQRSHHRVGFPRWVGVTG